MLFYSVHNLAVGSVNGISDESSKKHHIAPFSETKISTAYGLGLDVIYTCRNDWSEDQILKDKPDGDDVPILYDDLGQEVRVRKEGIHFDLEHMNRVEWDPNDLDDFRKKLENRIKAVIV